MPTASQLAAAAALAVAPAWQLRRGLFHESFCDLVVLVLVILCYFGTSSGVNSDLFAYCATNSLSFI